MGIRKLLMLQLLCAISLAAAAQNGKIKGLVTDEKTNEPLVGATVMLEGTTIGAITDFDGLYNITNIAPGTYTIRCSFISYETKLIGNITVSPGKELEYNFKLGESTVEIGGVEVVAKANRESESMLLVEQKNAVLAKQSIGAQEISRKGASDAEAAVTKVSGISKQEGVKNIFVRGLGDRFNSTTLNGFPVPSEDPEYKNISLDFFASDIIKTIGVDKVFNAGSSGDVGGAEIDISSKELIGEGEFNVNVSAKANTRSLTENFLVPDGVNVLGFGQNTESPTTEESYDFKNSLDPSSQSFQLGKDVGLSGGKRFNINNNPFSFYVIGNYSNEFSYTDGLTRSTTTSGIIFRDQTTEEYNKKSSHLAMANANYSFNKNALTYNALAIHTATQGLRDDYGYDGENFQSAEDEIGLVRRQQINENTLLVNQLDFKRDINKRLSAYVGVAFNYTIGDEPDRRVNNLSYVGDNLYSPTRGAGRNHRYYGKLKESDLNAIAKVKYKLFEDDDENSSVEFGYKGRFLHDDFTANSWDNSRTQSTLPTLDMYNFLLSDIFNQEEFEAGNFKNDEYNVSKYTVDKSIHSVSSELNYQFSEKFRMNFGLKGDIVNINIDYNVNDGAKKDSHSLDEFYLLPNLNLKYSLNEKNAFRLGASRTYTLPQSKEISPLAYEGPQWSSQGNPDLVPSVNYNLDLKWDFYPSNDQLISITLFGKLIQDPLSKVEEYGAGGFLSYDNIADNAKLAGIELEIRKNLFSILKEESNARNKLSTGINFSYLSTGIETKDDSNFTNEKTELEGAAPVIANGDLSYNYRKSDLEFTASVVANYVSEHIYSIGANGYNDINENSRTTLDFVTSLKMNKHWGFSLKAKNLLDPEFKLTREPSVDGADAIVLRTYKKGISLSLGLSYNF